MPGREECVIPHVLRRRALEHPLRTYAVFDDGTTWSYEATREVALKAASGLAGLGVAPGDTVLSWLPNGPDALRVWFGANQLGATYVSINTAYRGRLLEHVIDNSGARVVVTHADLAERLQGIRLGRLEDAIVIGGHVQLPAGLRGHADASLSPDAIRSAVLDSPAEPWDPYAVIYTSGTTGPSKGVTSSYVHLYDSAMAPFAGRFGETDRYMVNLPLFHAGGTIGVLGAMALGGSIAVTAGFDTSTFWEAIERSGTTCCTLLGVMASFLVKQPALAGDREHGLRWVYMIPLSEDAPSFAQRFGLDVYTLFNMTEVSCPLISELNPPALGSCGKPRPGVEARLVDEHDREVSPGEVGELMLRCARPWAMNSGYRNDPAATARAWRNGWFHTGDAFRTDGEGNFYFVDRMKDAIRRRGENISSFEVEAEVLSHPAVRECAAVAVPSAHSEDEVLVVVALAPGTELNPVHLIEYLASRTPYYMVPRYIRIVDELPKTPTNKVEKHLLRQAGLTTDTWDREAAGIRLHRERFDTPPKLAP